MLFLCNITSVAQRTFEIIQNSKLREDGDIIISTRMYVDCAHVRVLRLPFPAAASLLLRSFFNCFLFLFMLFLCNIASVAQKTFEIIQNSKSREHGDIIISTRMYVDCVHMRVPRLPTCEVPCDVSRKLQLTLCAIMAS